LGFEVQIHIFHVVVGSEVERCGVCFDVNLAEAVAVVVHSCCGRVFPLPPLLRKLSPIDDDKLKAQVAK
jgi:hypothetical protein